MTTELSGVDLARQALAAAREAAKKNGATARKPKRPTTVVRRDGREPLGLGSAISQMLTERGMVAPAAGGSVLADFDAVLAAAVPELTGRVKTVRFDAENGRLDVVPDAPAVGTQLRWSAPKLIAAANRTVPKANVRALRVLTPAAMTARPTSTAAAPVPQPAPPAAPVERRMPPDGYRRAIEAHRQAALRSRVDPRIAEAAARQNRVMREISRWAFPDLEEFTNEQPASTNPVLQRRREFAATETVALHRARAERARRPEPAPLPPQVPSALLSPPGP
ncbi:DciA family protein [Streptomyces goshikiensis]|uniref:DciA family protein n=1 Tax=Streptomyces goshikiensis TaxID=1942 RepID=UPI003653B61B